MGKSRASKLNGYRSAVSRQTNDVYKFNEEWKKSFADGNTEKGISGKYSQKTHDNKVDVGFVKSTEYRKKFENLDENENTQKAIWQKARDILVHRNGTNKEDMYLISVIDGKIKGKSVAAKEDNIVEYNKSLRDAVEIEPRGTLISIHNHGTNIPPTGACLLYTSDAADE